MAFGFLKTDWRNIVIVVLAAAVLALGALALPEKIGAGAVREVDLADDREVTVLDLIFDRENLQSFDLVFSRPLGEKKLGEFFSEPPATIEPPVGGTWRWFGANVLRFQATSRLQPATKYRVSLIGERLLRSDQKFVGDTSFEIVTDRFQALRVDTREEPAAGGLNQVLIRGEMHFNYAVDAKELYSRTRLIDPFKGPNAPLQLHLETTFANRVFSFRSEPVAKERQARTLELRILSDLTPVGGNVPLGADFVAPIAIGSRVNWNVRTVSVQSGESESTVKLALSSPVDAETAAKYIEIDPEVDFRISAGGNDLFLAGAFQPGETYQLKIGAGLPARDESTLADDYTQQLNVPDLPASVHFRSEGMFLSASGYRNLEIEAVNVQKVQLTVERIYRNNLVFLFSQYNYLIRQRRAYRGGLSRALGDQLADETLTLGGPRNQAFHRTVSLDRYISEEEPGLYRVVLRRPDSYYGEQRWVLITDLGIVAKRGREDFLVWASSFKDLRPIANARVQLLSSQNQRIAEGRTDSQGLWRLSAETHRFEKAGPYLVTLEKGEDFSFLLLANSGVDTAGLDVSGDRPASTGYQAYLYGERDLYRPGETVKGLAIVRKRDLGTPPDMPLTLRHRDAKGRERSVHKLELKAGVAEFAVDVPVYERTGNHWFDLIAGEDIVGRYRFQIEEFVPDRIKVEISTEKEDVLLGETLRYEVQGAYLFGPAAGGLPVESRVRLVSARFSPASFSGFQFGNPERHFAGREIFTQQASLDEEGRRSFETAAPPELKVPYSLEAVITARVQEQGGRGVTAMQRRRVHPYPYYLGLRRQKEGYGEAEKEEVIEYVAVDPAGRTVPAGSLQAQFLRDRWHTVLRRTPSGNFRYQTVNDPQLIESRTLDAGSSRGTLRLTPPDFGSYRVVLTDPDTGASSQIEFYVSGWGYSPWAIKNPSRLEIDLEKEEYRPGQNAVLQIRAPFPGKLLLTVERGQVFHTEVHNLTGNTARLSVPVRAAYRPNAYVTATLIRSVDQLETGGVARAFGAVPLFVDRTANRLPVQIDAPEVIRPNTTLAVDVKGPPNGIVTVAAVDEGILQLIAQKTADPFAYFYRKMGLRVGSYDIFALLLPDVAPIEGASAAGGGRGADGLAQFVRTEGIRRVEPVAFWSGATPTDSSGKATVEFELPDFQGALRVMAVAHKGDRFGSAEWMTRVRSPLALLPTFPRFLSFQESVMIPVTVRNDTGRPGGFEAELKVEGPAELAGPERLRVEVPNSAERTVYFSLKTGDEVGDLRFHLTARGNGESASAGVNLSIRPDLPAQSLKQTGPLTENSTTLSDEGRERFRPGTVNRQLRISSLPMIQFAGNLRYLLRYPYGCLEQTVSRVFPLVYFEDLAREIDPELFAESEPAVLVQEGIRRLSSMQVSSGGFAMWPYNDTVYPWGSIYAAHFLVEARRAGYQVADWVYDRALAYLAHEVKAISAYSRPELKKVAYGLFVLARAGKPDLGTMDFIRDRYAAELKASGRALLGSAYASMGNPDVLKELIRGLEEAEQMARQSGGNLNSIVRNRALLLLAVLEADADDPRAAVLVERLVRDARSSYWTTQENAFAFLALGQFFRRQAEKGPYSGTVLLGGKEVGRFTEKTALFRDLGAGPVTVRMDPGYEPGAAFYSLALRGIPRDEAFQPSSQGLEVRRQLRTRDGRLLSGMSVAQGDLVVVRTQVRSVSGPLQNVAVSTLLPAGLEVENPRLKTTEASPWMRDANLNPNYQDLRDDRVLFFIDLPANKWRTGYTLLRAVAPGSFRLPPVQAEAMYDPSVRASGERGTLKVEVRQ